MRISDWSSDVCSSDLFKYIEEESFQSHFQGLFSEINLASDKLGRKYADRNAKLCSIISKIADGIADFSTDVDALGDAYEYLIGQFAAGSGKKAGERSEEHTSELQSLMRISYAVFCLKKTKQQTTSSTPK